MRPAGWAAMWGKASGPSSRESMKSGEHKKRGAGGRAPARALAACGLGGRGIGRYHLLMSAGKAACRAARIRGALLAARSPSVRNNLPYTWAAPCNYVKAWLTEAFE